MKTDAACSVDALAVLKNLEAGKQKVTLRAEDMTGVYKLFGRALNLLTEIADTADDPTGPGHLICLAKTISFLNNLDYDFSVAYGMSPGCEWPGGWEDNDG